MLISCRQVHLFPRLHRSGLFHSGVSSALYQQPGGRRPVFSTEWRLLHSAGVWWSIRWEWVPQVSLPGHRGIITRHNYSRKLSLWSICTIVMLVKMANLRCSESMLLILRVYLDLEYLLIIFLFVCDVRHVFHIFLIQSVLYKNIK